MDYINNFILVTLSGMATIIGYFVIFIKRDKNKIICFCLSFASGVMLTISFLDLIPSSFNYLNYYYVIFRMLLILLFIILGMLLKKLFDIYIPSTSNNSLYKLGIMTLIGIIIHNILEGIITFTVSIVNFKAGLTLGIAILLHNIPEGISISVPIYYSTFNKKKTFFVVLLASLSESFGGFIAYLFFRNIKLSIIGLILSFTAGIMINMGICLFRESICYKKSISIFGFFIGLIIMLITIIL